MITLDDSLATNTANSYVDVDYCDTYWSQHYSSTKAALWAGLSSNQKALVLIHACRVIETIRFTTKPGSIMKAYAYRYDRRSGHVIQITDDTVPMKYYHYQTLQFPRNLDVDYTDGGIFIPEPIQMAQCEQAVYLISLDESLLSNRLLGVDTDSLSVGTVKLSQSYSGSATPLAPMALEQVKPFILRTTAPLRRG